MNIKLLTFPAICLVLFLISSCDTLLPMEKNSDEGSQLMEETPVQNEEIPGQNEQTPEQDEQAPEQNEDTSVQAAQNIGRGYNIFGNYADTTEVRDPVLDLGALEKAGLIETRAIERSTFQSATGSTISEYSSQMAVNAGVSGGVKAFSGSVETNFSSETYNKAQFSYATIQSQIFKSEISITNSEVEDLKAFLSPTAKTDINNADLAPEDLFAKYGTHVIQSLFTGGRLDYNMAFDMSQITSGRSLSVMASASWDAKFISATISTETVSENERTAFESHAQKTLNVYGGSSEFGQNILNDNDYRQWIESIDEHSQFVGFPKSRPGGGLIGIWEFAEDSARRDDIEEAFNDLGSTQGIEVDNSLTVEVTLKRVHLIDHDDAGDKAEIFGHAAFQGNYAPADPAFYGPYLWRVYQEEADEDGELGRGEYIDLNERSTRTFENFDESNSYILLYGKIWEDDVTDREYLGYETNEVYMRDGWDGVTEHKLYFRNAGTRVEEVFTIRIIN